MLCGLLFQTVLPRMKATAQSWPVRNADKRRFYPFCGKSTLAASRSQQPRQEAQSKEFDREYDNRKHPQCTLPVPKLVVLCYCQREQ